MKSQRQIHFGPYRFDPETACVWQGEQARHLPPKAFAVLGYLLEHAGRLVTKDELFHHVWPDVYVSDGALKECIRELRKTLGDDAKRPQFIETVHRRGFRFIAPVVTRVAANGSNPNPGLDSRAQTPPLVGRAAEFGQLQAWWERALAGERQVVFVTGEAGIGKTTLLQAFLARLRAENELWLSTGQCIEQYGGGRWPRGDR